MTVKITLITPPDIFQNDNRSVLLINLPENEQNDATEWLGNFNSDENLNIYFYQGEIDVPWLLHSLSTAHFKYINLDNMPDIIKLMAGYIIGKTNTFYSTTDANLVSLYSYINNGHIGNVKVFFERTLSAKK